MHNELFPDSQVAGVSPRLAWIQRHKLELHDFGDDHAAHFGAHQRWMCSADSRTIGTGATQDEALVDWATKMHVKLWNE